MAFCVVLLAAVLVGCGADDSAAPDDAGSDPNGRLCSSCGGCDETVPITSRSHIPDDLKYPDPPPAAGDHNPCWARWGSYTEAVPDERWVHNLEHGGVVLLYDCPTGCPDELAALTVLARANPRTVLSPYPELRTRFAIVAWGQRLQSDCIDSRAFQAFYDAHFDHSPESIAGDPPADCN